MLISQAIKSEEIWHDEEYGTEILEEIHKRLSEKLYK
jgi:shikimate dehydrogenase substrate binding domain protein